MMGQVRALARAEARTGDEPALVLDRLNRTVCDVTGSSDESLVTCCYVQLEPRDSVLRASAGHPPPLLRLPVTTEDHGVVTSAVVETVPLRPGPPLGVLDRVRYHGHRQLLPADSSVVMFTDGLVKRHAEPFDVGLARAREQLAQGPDDVGALCDGLLVRLIGDGPPDDDVALVAARPGGRRLSRTVRRSRAPAEP